MNRRDLVRAVAVQTGLDARQVDATLQGFTDVVTAVVSKGENVSIPGFAKFAKVERAARMGRNPATGETIRIKASKRARITALKGFKESVMNPGQAPKLNKGVHPLDPELLKKAATARKAAAAPAKKAAKKTAKKAVKKAARKTVKKAAKKRAPARKAAARRSPAKKAVRRAPARKSAARRAPARRR